MTNMILTDSGEPAAVKLKRKYDPKRLLQDLENLKSFDPVPQPSFNLSAKYNVHRGEWRGIALYSQSGDMSWGGGRRTYLEAFRPTPALEVVPYLREITEEFDVIRSVRVLTLPPGGRIDPHIDVLPLSTGLLRLQIPIITHEDVELVIAGQRCDWQPGELWFGDFNFLHSVVNNSPIARYNFIIDTTMTNSILQMFPDEYLRLKNPVPFEILPDELPMTAEEMKRYVCHFSFPPISEWGDSYTDDPGEAKMADILGGFDGTVEIVDGKLTVCVNDRAIHPLFHAGQNVFYIREFGCGLSIHYDFSNGFPTIQLNHKLCQRHVNIRVRKWH